VAGLQNVGTQDPSRVTPHSVKNSPSVFGWGSADSVWMIPVTSCVWRGEMHGPFHSWIPPYARRRRLAVSPGCARAAAAGLACGVTRRIRVRGAWSNSKPFVVVGRREAGCGVHGVNSANAPLRAPAM
jgi:hypothetical protein